MTGPILALLAAFSLVGVALLGLAYWLSGLLLYPDRQPLTHSPADYGLPYEDVAFQSRDGLTLRGWWIPADTAVEPDSGAPTVILLHPMFGNRQGLHASSWPCQQRVAVDLLQTARAFHSAHWSVFMFDFRGHGESQAGLCAGGQTEDQDVAAAVDYVFGRVVGAPTSVAVMGFGLGASAALVAVGRFKGGTEKTWVFTGDSEGGAGWTEIPPANVKRLCAMVLVQPASAGVLLRRGLRRMSAPLSGLLVLLVSAFCRWRGGYPVDPPILLRFAREVRLPVLYAQGSADPIGDPGEVQALYAATPGARQLWWLDLPRGRAEVYAHVGANLQPVLDFLDGARRVQQTGA